MDFERFAIKCSFLNSNLWVWVKSKLSKRFPSGPTTCYFDMVTGANAYELASNKSSEHIFLAGLVSGRNIGLDF